MRAARNNEGTFMIRDAPRGILPEAAAAEPENRAILALYILVAAAAAAGARLRGFSRGARLDPH